MRKSKSDILKKGLGVGIAVLFIVVAFVPSINASVEKIYSNNGLIDITACTAPSLNSEEKNIGLNSYKTITKTTTSTMEVVKEFVTGAEMQVIGEALTRRNKVTSIYPAFDDVFKAVTFVPVATFANGLPSR